MGNVLADCRRYGLEQCELCTEVVHPSRGHLRGGATGTTNSGVATNAHRHATSGPAHTEVGSSNRGAGTGRGGHDHLPPNMSEASGHGTNRNGADAGQRGAILGDEDPNLLAAIAASYASGNPNASRQTEEELVREAVRRSKLEEEARARARLRDEQAQEYEESLRIDQQREAEKACRQKEEEEKRRVEQEEAAKAEEEERMKREKIATLMEEARQRLNPEPADGESGRLQVLVRLPDGRRLKRAFLSTDCVSQIYDYVNVEGGALGGQEYRLVSAIPRVLYEDQSLTLASVGLQGQCALLVEVIDE